MINGSTAFNNAVEAGGYPYIIRISENGTVIDCEVFACSIYKGTTGNEAFGIGTVFVPYVELEISSISTPLENKELLVECGVQISPTQTEWINIGYFKVTKNNGSTIKSTVTAVGRIASTLSTLTPTLTTPTTIASVIQDIQTAVRTVYSGFTINTSSVDITGGEITGDISGRNCRQLLELVTGLIGGYATEDNSGNVAIFKYGSNVIDYSGTRMTAHPIVSNSDFILDNIKVIQTEESTLDDGTVVPEVSYQYDSSTTPKLVIINSYMASQTMFNKFCANCIGLTYRSATIALALGDPRIEASDVLRVTDTNGSVYRVPAMSVVHTLTGGITSTIITPGETTTEAESTAQGPITQRVDLLTSSVASAQTSAELAKAAADQAKAITDEITAYAETAEKTVTQILEDGETASDKAQEAIDSAEQASLQAGVANVYANSALDQLGVVQDVVGVLDLLSNKADYQVTTDEEVVGGKWYFTREGTSPNYSYHVVDNPQSVYHLTEDTAIDSTKTYYTRSGTGTEQDPYIYTAVATPVVADIGTYYEKYYEMVGIDASVKDYVTSRLVVTSDGLSIQDPTMQTRILLSPTEGVILKGASGTTIGKYGETAQIGDSAGFHIDIGDTYNLTKDTAIVSGKTYYTRSGDFPNYAYTEVASPVVADIGTYYEKVAEIGFYQALNKVAYINNNQLYITQSVVLQQMDLGLPVVQGGFGQWSWKVHKNGQTPSRNNLNLKWIG